jgi:hypothetical protein
MIFRTAAIREADVTSSEGAEHDETREAAGEDLDLTDEQADSVKGGVKNSDIPVTKPVDKPSNP